MTAWIGIIGTVIGALLAGGAAWLNARSQIRRQEERDRKKYILSKLEELYEAITHLRRHYAELTIREMMHLAGRIPMEPSKILPLPIGKIQMLIGFYAPELEPLIDVLLKCRNDYSAVLARRIELGMIEVVDQEETLKCLADFRTKSRVLAE